MRVVVITGDPWPRIETPVIFTLAADHGVATEGVSAYPQAVTAQMLENLARGGAAVNVLAHHVGARVVVADLGVVAPPGDDLDIVRCRVAAGTRSITEGPAMTRAEAVRAILAGSALVHDAAPDCVGTGEMGIGNTTSASALTVALTGADPAMVTGRGTGVSDDIWIRKVEAVRRALAVNSVKPGRPPGRAGRARRLRDRRARGRRAGRRGPPRAGRARRLHQHRGRAGRGAARAGVARLPAGLPPERRARASAPSRGAGAHAVPRARHAARGRDGRGARHRARAGRARMLPGHGHLQGRRRVRARCSDGGVSGVVGEPPAPPRPAPPRGGRSRASPRCRGSASPAR